MDLSSVFHSSYFKSSLCSYHLHQLHCHLHKSSHFLYLILHGEKKKPLLPIITSVNLAELYLSFCLSLLQWKDFPHSRSVLSLGTWLLFWMLLGVFLISIITSFFHNFNMILSICSSVLTLTSYNYMYVTFFLRGLDSFSITN